ncbi:MAG: hypothetical protein HYV33_05775 [Candidatus Kerfeldbacteria bacterium]|nr:hypothetical protein [Candidatus Kerfeldbacteria bacterium]
MEINYHSAQALNMMTLLRQMGYHPITDYHTEQASWVRTLGRGYYPRFHLYLKQNHSTYQLSLHLDQKQHTIAVTGLKRHAGEYHGAVVEQEAQRLQRWLQYAETTI